MRQSAAHRLQWFPFDPEILGDATDHLTCEELGMYHRLIRKAWRQTPPATIPNNDSTLALWAGATSERWAACKSAVLAPFEPCEPGRCVLPWLLTLYEEQRAKMNRRISASREGGIRNKSTPSHRVVDYNSTPPISISLSESSSRSGSSGSPEGEPEGKPPTDRSAGLRAAAKAGCGGDWTLDEINAVLAAYPQDGIGKPAYARHAICAALDRIRDRGEQDAPAWLLGRTKAYGESPAGKAGIFAGGIIGWMNGDGFDAPPEAWQRRAPKDDQPVSKLDPVKMQEARDRLAAATRKNGRRT